MSMYVLTDEKGPSEVGTETWELTRKSHSRSGQKKAKEKMPEDNV